MNYQKCFGPTIRTELQTFGTARIDRERVSRSFLRQKVASQSIEVGLALLRVGLAEFHPTFGAGRATAVVVTAIDATL